MKLSPHAITAIALQSIKTIVDNDSYSGRLAGSSNIPRQRVPVETIFSRLGPRMFKKCYRMTETTFWKLHGLLMPFMKSHSKKRKRGITPNGDIPSSSRLSMALRWFAGGDPADIFQVHGVGYDQVYISVWEVVDAINQCPELQIAFPTDHHAQLTIADGFKKKSRVDFETCVGCIDGMLIWINKPNQQSTRETGVGPKKFFCGRKKKFGITLQGICDHKRRFLDIELGHPGSTSDYMGFTTSAIHKLLLANPNFLAPNLVLFGDSAYVNTPFMATPYKGSHSGPKDAYNFYHSQLRINIECAFGMLVHRWGVLRKPLPVNITVPRATQLVRSLCILHNFCIDEKEAEASAASSNDVLSGMLSGGFVQENARSRPEPLIDSGHHFEDVSRNDQRNIRRRQQRAADLPRDHLLAHIVAMGITTRPAPLASTSTNL